MSLTAHSVLHQANEVIEKAIADYTKMSEEEIRQLFFEAGQVSDDFYSEVYEKSGQPFVPLEDNPYMQQFLSAGIEQTQNELVNFTRSITHFITHFFIFNGLSCYSTNIK